MGTKSQSKVEAEEGGTRTPPDVGVPADSPQGEEEDEG